MHNKLSGSLIRAEVKKGHSYSSIGQNHSPLEKNTLWKKKERLWLCQRLCLKAPNYLSSPNLKSCSYYGWIPSNGIHSLWLAAQLMCASSQKRGSHQKDEQKPAKQTQNQTQKGMLRRMTQLFICLTVCTYRNPTERTQMNVQVD